MEKQTTDTPAKGFVTDVFLAALLREYYSGDVLYMGTDADLKELRGCCADRDKDGLNAAACGEIITFTTLCSALNAPFCIADKQKMKISEEDVAERLARIGRLRFYGDDLLDLRIAAQNLPFTLRTAKKWYNIPDAEQTLQKARSELEKAQADYENAPDKDTKKALSDAKAALRYAERRLSDVKKTYCNAPAAEQELARSITRTHRDGKTVYVAQVNGYKYEYRVPDGGKGKPFVYVEDGKNPARHLLCADGAEQGVDVRRVADLVSCLPALQSQSDEAAAEDGGDDFGALLGFRLRRVETEELFPRLDISADEKAVLHLTDKNGDSRLYRIEPSAKQKSLSMILTAYLPYLSTSQKLQLESSMALSRKQQELYLDILDVYGSEPQQGAGGLSDPLKVLDAAVDVVLAAKAQYMPQTGYDDIDDYVFGDLKEETVPALREPDFWVEFQYTKWDWIKCGSRVVPILKPILDAAGKPKTIQMLPYQIVSSEGKIYLVGLRLEMPNKLNRIDGRWVLSNLRVDRIRNLRRVTAAQGTLHNPEKRKEELQTYYQEIADTVSNNIAYRNSSPQMFSGTPERLVLDCSPVMTNVLVDTFGAEALKFCGKVPAPGAVPGGAKRPDWNRIRVNACWDGVRLFLLQNLQNVQLSALPAQAAYRRQMHDLLLNAGKNYSE